MLFGRYRASRPDAGTSSAGYCYAVWLRHLVLCHRYGGLDGVPKVVAELGPGNSLGTGLAALISGAEKYYALDVVDYSPTETNLLVFDALVKMFKQRRSIPVGGAYSAIKVELDSYGFPFEILSEEKLKCALDPVRIQGLREAVAIGGVGNAVDGPISHVVPWNDAQALSSNAVELISSMSVLEHIDDLATAYSACAKWLKPGGLMSHEIDYRCHGLASQWNGHWAYSGLAWKVVRGRRPFLINRQPHSVHAGFMSSGGFDLVLNRPLFSADGVARPRLAREFRGMGDADFRTSNGYLLARRR